MAMPMIFLLIESLIIRRSTPDDRTIPTKHGLVTRGWLATKLLSKFGEEGHAGVKLGGFNKFIRHMGLLDVARAADHRRAACLL